MRLPHTKYRPHPDNGFEQPEHVDSANMLIHQLVSRSTLVESGCLPYALNTELYSVKQTTSVKFLFKTVGYVNLQMQPMSGICYNPVFVYVIKPLT